MPRKAHARLASCTAVPAVGSPRRVAVPARIVALLLSGALVAAACGGGKHHAQKAKPGPSVAHSGKLELHLGDVDVQSAGPAAKLSSSLETLALRSTQTYLDDAVLAPVERGQVDRGYEAVFDPFVRPDASGPDRDALTEANTGLARGLVTATATPVRIDALGDEIGKIGLLATTFSMDLQASTPLGAVSVRRHTELTFADEYGKWLVTAYRVTVRRKLENQAATTTTVARSGNGSGGSGA